MNYLRSVCTCLLLTTGTIVLAQTKTSTDKKQKYQGLLWEISGKHMQKPSYLFGTMHVSSKLAFNLSDSFYQCIRNADVVALETNPVELQEDFSNSSMLRLSSGYLRNSNGFMTKDAFTIGSYSDILRTGLVYRPEMINHLLYRSMAMREDFEEDTFLDMYIYQVGSKLGKRATGVENFAESERLMLEAYRDAANDKKAKKNTRSVDPTGEKLNDAYRRGDLDMLDSISGNQFGSAAFLEKFLYKRNENMFHSIDSIIRTSSLFAGVGAAHLPGERGVINLLRKAGYTVRPILMTNRDSEQKDQIEKMKAPVVFRSYTSEDGLIKAEIPGKLYNFSSLTLLNQLQYADLANGAYYLISRIRTNALSLGQSEQDVFKKIDSLLYENIPGKIIEKKTITRNGYTGFEIRNRTRRGDLQRYNIMVTPFEVLIFKLSGTGDYVAGPEAERFFNSIRLKPMPESNWVTYTAPFNNFSIKLPHAPVTGTNFAMPSMSKRQEFEALDKKTMNSYLVVRKTIPDYEILEEDTTDISFAEESFQQSQFIKTQKSRRFINWKGRQCLEILNQNTDNSFTQTRILLQGPHYYILSARYRNDQKSAQEFFHSFIPGTPAYTSFQQYKDTSLFFSVNTAVKPNQDNELMEVMSPVRDDESYFGSYRNRSKVFLSDSTGEEINVEFEKFNRYYSVKDSAHFWENVEEGLTDDGNYVIASRKYEKLPGWESLLLKMRDTNSTRNFLAKVFVRSGAEYTIRTIVDEQQEPSAFVRTFFDSFRPADTLFGASVYLPKGDTLLLDFFSKDSTTRTQARKSVARAVFRDESAPGLIRVIQGWNTSEKNYLDVKCDLIRELGMLKHPAVLPFLRNAYAAANDTAALQHVILQSAVRQQTKEGYNLFKEMVMQEIPIFGANNNLHSITNVMEDSLELAAPLFPDLLKLTALADYKYAVYGLLAELVDSNAIQPSVYEPYIAQIAFDGRVEIQQQLAAEQNNMDRDEDDRHYDFEEDASSATLKDFATLLFPYRKQNKNAERFFGRYETSTNPAEQIQLAGLYLRHQWPVRDSILQSIAAKDKYRVLLWQSLNDIHRLDKFPASWKKQEAVAKSVLYSNIPYNTKLDTMVMLGKQHTVHRFKKGTVYLYKYKQKEDDEWYLALSGLQPDDEKQSSANQALTEFTNIIYQTDKPLGEQFTKVLRLVKYKNRYGWDKNVVTDMVDRDY